MVKTIGISLLLLIVFFSGSAFVQSFNLPQSVARGKDAYTLYCQNCHMVDGKGQPGAFPPLAKSDFLKKTAKDLINNTLKGQSGDITVNGIKYNGVMPAQDYLSDEQIADILNYVRNSWGNKSAIAITPAQVKKTRG